MGLFGDAAFYQRAFDRRRPGISGFGKITGDTGMSAFEFASKYQQVGGAGSHTYAPRGGRQYVGGWGEMSPEDATGLSTLLGRSKVLPIVGGAGTPLTTGYGKAQGFQRRLMGSMPLGLPPGEESGDGGKLITTLGIGWILYKVLI